MFEECHRISFQVIGFCGDDITAFVEESTDVIYLKIQHGYNMGGLTPMLDPETGLPLTYKVWKEKYYK